MNISVASLSTKFATRQNGAMARERVLLEILANAPGPITLDFQGIEPTPSFADEFVGRLAAELGATEFQARIRFANLDESATLLLRAVVAKRLGGGSPTRSHRRVPAPA